MGAQQKSDPERDELPPPNAQRSGGGMQREFVQSSNYLVESKFLFM